MQDFFDVKVITIADLRADQEGVFISQSENNRRTFYVSGLGVSLKYRRCGIAEQLSMTLLKELPIRDVNYPQRSYWLLAL